MASTSSKDTFEAETFSCNTFACGAFRGRDVGDVPGMEFRTPDTRMQFAVEAIKRLQFRVPDRRMQFKVDDS